MTELDKLEKYLKEHSIPYERVDEESRAHSGINRHQIGVPTLEPRGREWDAVCHYGSYGYEEGLLEIYGTIAGNDVVGWLTAENVIKRIEEM